MKQTYKKQSTTNIQTKRSTRVESRENKRLQEKPSRTLRAKEADKKTSPARVISSIVASDPKKSGKPTDAYEKYAGRYIDEVPRSEEASRNSKTLQVTNQNEPNDGREESDSDMVTDSTSSSGDSRATEDEKVEPTSNVPQRPAKKDSSDSYFHEHSVKSEHDLSNLQINTSSIVSMKTKGSIKESPNSIAEYLGNNSKGMKVHPKPSSISSKGVDDQDSVEPTEVDIFDEASSGIQSVGSDDGTHLAEENTEHEAKEALERKIAQMETRIQKLEEELSEVAALEISLYSAVQEHCGSGHKLHIAAEQLSRLYINAGTYSVVGKRASIARNTVSGLVLISKSCGNDVPRLTFWWSNIIVLREIVTQAFGDSCQSSSLTTISNLKYASNESEGKTSPLPQRTNSGSEKSNKPDFMEFDGDWQETRTFTSELEKVESRIFSRIVESIWSQTLMPSMQSLVAEKNTSKTTEKSLGPNLGDQKQSSLSINLWQNAFHDAFKRLCPVRARGHKCGCLPVLAKMVMEDSVARLDAALFNAILHEPAHEISTSPVSDPFSVLPIPAGDLSFGSGAQLKKAVGNWSRWLTDRFSMDTDARTGELKCFHLLNSLSGLLMVPKDMLMDRSIRDEVCPSISLALLKQILSNFTPDEFCPDPVPDTVMEEVNAEVIEHGSLEDDNSSSSSFPYAAATITYKPPSSVDIAERVGGNTGLSDEELDSFIPAIKGNARYKMLVRFGHHEF